MLLILLLNKLFIAIICEYNQLSLRISSLDQVFLFWGIYDTSAPGGGNARKITNLTTCVLTLQFSVEIFPIKVFKLDQWENFLLLWTYEDMHRFEPPRKYFEFFFA